MAPPVHEPTVAEAAKHADNQHGMRPADPAEVVVMGDIEALMQAGFDAPGGAIEAEPLLGAQFLGRQAGDQGHCFGAMVSQVPVQQGDLFHAGKIDRFGGGGPGTQHAPFGLAFVELTFAGQGGRRLRRGKNPPEGRALIFECWL